MANKFKSKLQANIAFSTPGGFANIGAYSVPTGCVATVIGMSIANMNVTTQATVDIQVNKGTGPTGNIRLLQAAPVPIGGALVAVLEVNQSMQVKATTGNVDVIMSILESDQT